MKSKANRKVVLSMLSLAAGTAAMPVAAHADLLADWNFGTATTGTVTFPAAASHGTGTLTTNFPSASIFTGTTLNAVAGDTAGGAIAPAGSANNGDYLQFTLNLTGYNAPVLTYAAQATATGFKTEDWFYSTNGVNFTEFQAVTGLPTAFALQTVDFSSLTSLANDPSVMFEVVFTGATSTTGNNRLDNIQFNATTFTGGTSSTLYWTADGATLGGTGTWNNGSNNWSTFNTSIAGGVWNSSMLADFAGTAGTVSIDSGGITANAGIIFDVDGYILNGAGILTLGGATPTITVSNASTSATINAQISGAAGLTISGLGTLILTNTANNFTGAVTIGGKLSIADDRVLGDPGNAVTFAGGTLQTTASVSSARTFSGTGSLNIANGTTLASTGTFSTTGLTLSNTGTLDLQGSSSVGSLNFTGAGTLTSSTGQLINATALNAANLTGTAIISGAGGFALAGTATVTVQVGPSTGSPAGDLNIQTALTLGGTGNNSLKKTGTGTLELNGVNDNLWRVQIGSESATATVIGGTVIINNNQSLGNNQLFLNNGTLQASTDLTNQTANGGSDNSIGIGVSIGGLDNGPAVLAGSNMEFQGASDLFQASAAQSHLTVNNTTILDGAFTSGTGTGTGLTIDGIGKLTINGDASAMTLATNVSGTATLEINNNWGAAITVNTGARLQGHGTIAGAVSIASGGTIAPGSSTTTLTINNSLSLATGSNSAFTIDAPATAGLGNSSNIAGITTLSYGGNLAITLGTGTFATGDSWKLFTFTAGQTGSFDNNGLFGTNASGSSFLPDLSILDSSDPNAKWFFNYATGTLSIADSGGSGAPASLLWTGGNATWDQASSVWQNSAPNDTIWNNTANGPATVAAFNTASTIAIDAAGVASNGLNFQAGSSGILLNGTGAITLNGPIVSVDPSVTATIAAKISGTSGLDLLGGGTLILSSTASDFTGTVSINAGILSISDDRNLGNSSNAIALNGGTLQTTASINTARNLSGAGTLDIAPATTFASTGTFTTTSLALVNTGTLDLQGSAPNVGALTLTVASTLTSSTGQQITASGITATNLTGTATISSTGGLNLGTATSTINVGAAGTLILQAPITGAQLTNAGPGTLDLFGNNSTMTRVSMSAGSGIININNPNALGNSQLFFNGGTLNATTDLTSATGNALPIGISIGTDSATGSAAATLTGSNMEFTGATGLFEEPNEFTHISVQNTTTLSGAFTSDSPSFAGIGLIVDGGGTLVINGDASGMLRNTIVNGNTSLIINNNFGGAVTLNSGTLAGHGTIAAAVTAGTGSHTIAPSATLSPTSTGILTMASLTTSSNTTLAFNLVTANSTAGVGNDTIMVTGNNGLTLNGGQIQIANAPNTAASLGFYKLIGYSGSIGGTGLSSLTLPATANNIAYTFDTTHDAGFIDIHRGFLGDVDDSGFVDINDLAILAANWQQAGGWSQGNFLNDPTVDINDLAVLATNWQTGIGGFDEAADSLTGTSASFQEAVSSIVFGGTSSVPEPTSLALLGMGAAGLLIRRRNRR